MRILRIFLLTILATLFIYNVRAQSEESNWYEGKVQLINGEQYDLTLRFVSERTGGLLQVYANGESMTLSPKKVKSFLYFDSVDYRFRYFISVIAQSPNNKFEKQTFLEVLYEGASLSLLKRNELNGIINTQSLYIYENSTESLHYFAMSRWAKHDKTPYFNPNLKMLYSLTQDHRAELKDFSQQHSLNLKYTEQVIRFLAYYDYLSTATGRLY